MTPSEGSCPCPVCGASTRFWFAHPDAHIYRCPACTHTFSRLDTVRRFEQYDAAYYLEAHPNWCTHPNLGLFRWIERQLPASAASILDVGSGNGDFLRHLRAQRRSARLVGVDVAPEIQIEGVSTLVGDVFTIDPGGPFDVVTSLAVIEHVPDPRAFATRLANLAGPDALVVVMTLNANGLPYLAARAARRTGLTVATDRLYATHHLHHFTPQSLRRVLEESGLEVERVHHHNTSLAAIDVPSSGRAVRYALLGAVAASFALGRSFRRCFLQTMVCRSSAQRRAHHQPVPRPYARAT